MSSKTLLTRLAISCLLWILSSVSADSPLLASNAPQENQQPFSSRQIVEEAMKEINDQVKLPPGYRHRGRIDCGLGDEHLSAPDAVRVDRGRARCAPICGREL